MIKKLLLSGVLAGGMVLTGTGVASADIHPDVDPAFNETYCGPGYTRIGARCDKDADLTDEFYGGTQYSWPERVAYSVLEILLPAV